MKLSLSLTLLTTLPFTLANAPESHDAPLKRTPDNAPRPIARDPSFAFLKRAPSNEAHDSVAHDIVPRAEEKRDPVNKANIPHAPEPAPKNRKLGKRLNLMKGVGEIILRPAKEELKDEDSEQWRQIATKKWNWREGKDGDDQGEEGEQGEEEEEQDDVARQQKEEVERKLQAEDNRKKQEAQAKKEQLQRERNEPGGRLYDRSGVFSVRAVWFLASGRLGLNILVAIVNLSSKNVHDMKFA
ncbi:hypothetical protein K491DRAFT_282275 [Lophiostoma macrostomum CBS 122681]|uniref:Uncharacterized protein n=1 Tax=Lophiostoma macrostomum CBS 122681 TaxID=1314788 RepID=A0A6A6TQU6_9PLEO|nr:hypothetical protein K491DRAFT_282275 [Lophiostoma macrostomum CBS 122681]